VPAAGLRGPPPHPRRAASRRPHGPAGHHRQGLQGGLAARDIDALIGLLDPDATLTGDGGGLVPAAPRPVEGGEQIARYLADLARAAHGNVRLLERTVNGQPGLVAEQDGVTVAVYAFEIAGDQITSIWAILNPGKLRPWATG